ncbi:MAG: ABC transporter substrate-binding protein [Chloroflexi bacterium]|nr:ABC transporter substrate-binding protein [Chloroflexota bacterium]
MQRMIGKKKIVAVLLGLALALALTACGPAAQPAPSGGDQKATEAQQIKRGGIARKWAPGAPGSLDPGKGDYWVACELNNTYGKLLEYRAQSYTDSELVPSLVEKWEIKDGGKSMVLSVRKGVKWQNIPPVNGREFTAQDIAWNIDWYKKSSEVKWLWTPVTSYQVNDNYTITLNFDEPSARFFQDLGSPWNEMLPREVWEKDGAFNKTIIGTGPFIFESFETDVRLVRKARPDYWKTGADGKALPYIDGWETVILKDYSTQLAALISGQVDLWRCLGGPEFKDLETVKKARPGVQINSYPRYNYMAISYNLDQEPWSDLRFRKAFSLAIDRQVIADAAWDGDAVWSSFVPPSLAKYAWPEAKVKEKFARNVTEAKRLLQEAGKTNVTVVDVPLPGGAGGSRMHEVIQQMVGEAGIKLEIKEAASRAARAAMVDRRENIISISTDTPDDDPDGFIGRLFESSTSSAQNRGIKDPKLDELAKAVRVTVDPAKRKEASDKAQDYLYEMLYRIPTVDYREHKVRQPWIRMPTAIYWAYGIPGMDELWLDK